MPSGGASGFGKKRGRLPIKFTHGRLLRPMFSQSGDNEYICPRSARRVERHCATLFEGRNAFQHRPALRLHTSGHSLHSNGKTLFTGYYSVPDRARRVVLKRVKSLGHDLFRSGR